MKLLLIANNFHKKNRDALFKYNIDINVYDGKPCDLSKYDVVYSPEYPIEVINYPNTKFIFGPHFSVFPNKEQIDIIRSPNTIYIQPSIWTADVWKNNPICDGINIQSIPFGVDTDTFCEIKPSFARNEVFVYFKRRNPAEFAFVINFMRIQGYNPRVFDYVQGYNERDYLNCLQNAKFGVWIDTHESQGFALEEALSCNVPLVVWNVKSMNQEYGSSYDDIPATTIPYWNNMCGEYFYCANELQSTFTTFINKLNQYNPRKYILENLSIQKCEQRFKEICKINTI